MLIFFTVLSTKLTYLYFIYVKNEWGRGGVKYKEGDRISLPTVDPDINEYKTYTVTWLKIIMMTLGWCRLVIKTQFIYSARRAGNHSHKLQNKAFSVGQRKMYKKQVNAAGPILLVSILASLTIGILMVQQLVITHFFVEHTLSTLGKGC